MPKIIDNTIVALVYRYGFMKERAIQYMKDRFSINYTMEQLLSLLSGPDAGPFDYENILESVKVEFRSR